MRAKTAKGKRNRFTLHLILKVGYVACVEHAADKFFDHWVSLEVDIRGAVRRGGAVVIYGGSGPANGNYIP